MTLFKKNMFSDELQKKIDELEKAGVELLETVHKMKPSSKPYCKNCLFYDVLMDPNSPKISGLCLSDDVLNLKMQPEPHPDFGCIFFKPKGEK